MTHPTLMRLKAMTGRQSRRLEGREREKAIGAATLLKIETERLLLDIERELRFLESRSPTIEVGWELPKAPSCNCGHVMHPVAVFDCGELWLEWGCECGETRADPAIDWPWVEEFVWPIDAAAAGFRVE